MYQCISIVTSKPEYTNNIIEAGKELSKIGKAEKGNIYYSVLRHTENSDTIIMIEKWESEKDFLAHVKNAGQIENPVHEFGELVNRCAMDSKIYTCEILA